MRAALRIVFDVLVYRLRRLEMANLAAAVSVMLALGTALPDLLLRTVFGAGLNLLAYLTNDACDVEQDLAEGRAPEKTRFLYEHRRAALVSQLALFALLAAFALAYDPGLLLALVTGAGICWVYSAHLKRYPQVDIASMVLWGVAMPLVAFPLGNGLGWMLVIQLGLFSACFEAIQVLRDHDEDQRAGVHTTAVELGPKATVVLIRCFMLLAALYASLVLDRYVGPLLALVVLLPAPALAVPAAVTKYWNQVRLAQGLGWLGLLLGVFLRGDAHGWLM
ncbi:MAG: UbiA family prenyltransferase [Polyangiaceae bacterium]|nr:UbiA family prenyltransferase [Polyangiaceae bacterium]MCW5791662.1 UbiA family prenyltransferase [Polyangiaceae bacterium]